MAPRAGVAQLEVALATLRPGFMRRLREQTHQFNAAMYISCRGPRRGLGSSRAAVGLAHGTPADGWPPTRVQRGAVAPNLEEATRALEVPAPVAPEFLAMRGLYQDRRRT